MSTHLALLSPELTRLSQSTDEIVLPWPQAGEAVETLALAGVASVAWEGWLTSVDGRPGHSLDHTGIQPMQREARELWPHFTERCRAWLVLTMQVEHQRFSTGERSEFDDLYFLLITREDSARA